MDTLSYVAAGHRIMQSALAVDTSDIDQTSVGIVSVGKQFPRIVDVDWRLDLVTNTSTLNKLNEPRFLVRLSVIDGTLLRDVQFSCNSEEMTDLLQKLKEAQATVEKISSTK
ncbi:putative COMM domain containing 3 [Blattamonas nauphoetae]|uniref:COMM domain-containing protein 3 n=1 Tax=Blattamonas nauphoetae TaxID=2049346 RepID=A0ABQ9Y984_9EUKA|nr:putative COMM domain containing 3 [Blattamonas nauphoetae]